MKLLLAAAIALCAINASAASTVVSSDDPRLQPAEVVRVEPSGPAGFPEIYVDGYIHKATVEAFKRLGNLNGSGMGMVYFNSLGGDLVAAVELGQLIRERGFSTRVGRKGTSGKPLPGRCESGCPFAFAGGRFRFLEAGSSLGVHQFYRAAGLQANDLSHAQIASALIASHLADMGVSMSLMGKMVSADSGSMRYLTPLEAYDMGLINAGTLPAQWGIREIDGAIVLVGEQETIQGTAKIALACGSHNDVEMAGLFKGWFDLSLFKPFNEVSLQVDGQPIGAPSSVAEQSIHNGFLSYKVLPTDHQLDALARAQEIGLQLHQSGTEHRVDFKVDAAGAGNLITSFVKLCRGDRPNLTGGVSSRLPQSAPQTITF
ncbi:hypothetical protein PZF67_005268 [Pseudomonas aeruginosa]|uniref:COG3904 family protein n=1 Tax=Pseudomonas aeruginosa TaxID=287 RepID=UPI0025CB52E0|nr:hypothetical protein [Pseudomonas aeruginosa]